MTKNTKIQKTEKPLETKKHLNIHKKQTRKPKKHIIKYKAKHKTNKIQTKHNKNKKQRAATQQRYVSQSERKQERERERERA